MKRYLAPIALAITLALVGVAQADQMAGNAVRDAARAGFITPHGVFDGR